MQVKYSYVIQNLFIQPPSERKNPTLNENPFRLHTKYSRTIPMRKVKLKDVIALTPYIPTAY
jgi:hypothetical protein